MWFKHVQKPVSYKTIVACLQDSHKDGLLKPGDKMLPVRQLADRLGVAPGTVARAYSEAEKEGLLQGFVGQGTFVTYPGNRFPTIQLDQYDNTSSVIDLTLDEALDIAPPKFSTMFRAMAEEVSPQFLLDYSMPDRAKRYNDAGLAWVKKYNISANVEDIHVTGGSQHAILCALSAVAKPGQTIAIEELAYPGIIAAIRMLGLKSHPIACDSHGMIAEKLDEACKSKAIKAVYVTPSAQNPTNGQLSRYRRKRLANISEKYDLTIIEDDIRPRFVLPAPDAIQTYAPNRTIFIAGLSKAIGGGLRVGYAVVPDRYASKFKEAIWASMWLPSPLTAEVATRLILSGEAETMVIDKDEEGAKRRNIVEKALDHWDVVTLQGSTYAWLPLPDGWTNASAVAAIRENGVSLISADNFWNGSTLAPNAIRFSFGTPNRVSTLESALEIIRTSFKLDKNIII